MNERFTIQCRLDPFWGTGTEGVIWSALNLALPGYDALHLLVDGDQLQVIDDDGNVLWDGVVQLEYKRTRSSEVRQQNIRGFYVHGFQDGLDPDRWADFFFKKRRAFLTTKLPDHPFFGAASDMSARLSALSSKRQTELYRSTMYGWLSFFSNGDWCGLAQDWGFSLNETLALIGNPTDEQILALRTFPKTSTTVVMPYDLDRFTRMALLFSVYGGLDWKFNTVDERATWLHDTLIGGETAKTHLLNGSLEGVMAVRALVTYDTR